MESKDDKMRKFLLRKSEKEHKKMNEVGEKIDTKKEIVGKKQIFNTYGILDENLCPQIARGEEYVKNLPKNILQIVKAYTGSAYLSINHSLRTERKVVEDQMYDISLIDIAFRNAPPLEVAMTVYRGVSCIKELRDDNGFSSCSLRKAVSNSFGRGNVFTITIPSGSRILFVKPISLVAGEDEVIIDRGGAFRRLTASQLVYVSHLSIKDDDE